MKIEIIYAGYFTRKEKMVQKLKNSLLSLMISGIDYMNYYDQENQRITPPPSIGKTPFLLLMPPGSTIDFSMNEKRENWAVLLNLPELQVRPDSLQYAYHKVIMNAFVPLSAEKVYQLRRTFERLCRNSLQGHPAGLEKANLLTGSILAEMISDPSGTVPANKEAEQLKKAIDSDLHFTRSILELNRELGLFSPVRMRQLFFREYGILPAEYRNRLRMNRILELFSQSALSLKAVADEVGMKNVTHLYSFLKKRQNFTPKELLQQFRGK